MRKILNKALLLFILITVITTTLMTNTAITQTDTSGYYGDSLYFRELDLKRISTNYFNLSKLNKFNFEVVVIGGVKNPGVYLIPEGTTLVEIVALTGGAPDESIFEDFKLIRTKNKNSGMKTDTVYVLNYNDFFDKERTGNILKVNPILKPGDIIAFPIKLDKDFWDIAQRIAGVIVVPILSLITLYIQLLIYNK